MNKYNFSYIIPGRLAGSRHPAVYGGVERGLDYLAGQGISGVVSLTEDRLPQQALDKYNMKYLHLPIPDFTAPTLQQALNFVEFVEHINNQGKAVAVHCFAGIGRTGTMLACYLVRMGFTAEQAIQRVRNLRPGSIETMEQSRLVYLCYEKFKKTE